ncbi:hypothetical protein CapIbe_010324 [Capra ibex]
MAGSGARPSQQLQGWLTPDGKCLENSDVTSCCQDIVLTAEESPNVMLNTQRRPHMGYSHRRCQRSCCFTLRRVNKLWHKTMATPLSGSAVQNLCAMQEIQIHSLPTTSPAIPGPPAQL